MCSLFICCYFVVKSQYPKYGLQRNYFFLDISKLIFHKLELLFDIFFVPNKPGPKFRSSGRKCPFYLFPRMLTKACHDGQEKFWDWFR